MRNLKKSTKNGKYYRYLLYAKEIVSRLNLKISNKKESETKYEGYIAGALQPNFEEFQDQRNTQQVISRISLFGFDHRPDMSIGFDGIAIEVKVIKFGHNVREAIGQAITYRINYRFVLLVLVVPRNSDRGIYEILKDTSSVESELISSLKNLNIYMMIK